MENAKKTIKNSKKLANFMRTHLQSMVPAVD